MKTTIEINDTIQERIDSAICDIESLLRDWLAENGADGTPELHDDLDYSGGVHEIIDSSVPVYANEIRDTMYLHGSEIKQAFYDSGIGSADDDWPMGWEAAAIYCYIQQAVTDWYNSHADDITAEVREGVAA